jgi:hypothetical protein
MNDSSNYNKMTMKYNSSILLISIVFLWFLSCKEDQTNTITPTKQTMLLSDNARSFFHYNSQDVLVFSDSLGNLIQFSVVSQPVSKIENSHEILYVNFNNDINSLKLLFELEAWENNLHHLSIGFFIQNEPSKIDKIATFNMYTDTNTLYFSFNAYDTTYNQTYDTIRLNQDNYYHVCKLWGNNKNTVNTVYITKEYGIVGFIDKSNKLWNLK